MKIAFDSKRFFNNGSGLGNYSRDLVRILAKYFADSQYLLIATRYTERGSDILKLQNVNFAKVPSGSFSRQLKSGIIAQKLGADIFHGLSGELPLRWNGTPIKKVVTIHDLIFLRYPEYYSFFDRKIHRWKFNKAAKEAHLIIAISQQTKRDIVHYLKVDERKIRVVYQGCHFAFKEKLSEDFLKTIRQKYHLPDRFILNVGTVESRKNLLNIAKAVTDTEIPVVVIGKKTAYFKSVSRYLNRNNLSKQFFFPENVAMEELAAIYRLADIFIYPSLFEGFGIPVIEALFSGTPVITSNRSSLPEAGGPHSLYVDPTDVQDIRAKIQFLWSNEAERKRRAEQGLAFAQKFYDENIAEELMAVYKELCQNKIPN